eukprot:CAMPEP_0174241490 /NCGR_PEP_ID=MMETSP0417-20130205/23530_1 /TAXON_ID=242541 /ORGANISM="Mayorella sp, Strain BSH-02190019" /LENGTH=746 /DNA_ID=CAMNT_0015320737 /DNA_START=43 /DNA_END=2283 /DNA_ORIENTATION=-
MTSTVRSQTASPNFDLNFLRTSSTESLDAMSSDAEFEGAFVRCDRKGSDGSAESTTSSTEQASPITLKKSSAKNTAKQPTDRGAVQSGDRLATRSNKQSNASKYKSKSRHTSKSSAESKHDSKSKSKSGQHHQHHRSKSSKIPTTDTGPDTKSKTRRRDNRSGVVLLTDLTDALDLKDSRAVAPTLEPTSNAASRSKRAHSKRQHHRSRSSSSSSRKHSKATSGHKLALMTKQEDEEIPDLDPDSAPSEPSIPCDCVDDFDTYYDAVGPDYQELEYLTRMMPHPWMPKLLLALAIPGELAISCGREMSAQFASLSSACDYRGVIMQGITKYFAKRSKKERPPGSALVITNQYLPPKLFGETSTSTPVCIREEHLASRSINETEPPLVIGELSAPRAKYDPVARVLAGAHAMFYQSYTNWKSDPNKVQNLISSCVVFALRTPSTGALEVNLLLVTRLHRTYKVVTQPMHLLLDGNSVDLPRLLEVLWVANSLSRRAVRAAQPRWPYRDSNVHCFTEDNGRKYMYKLYHYLHRGIGLNATEMRRPNEVLTRRCMAAAVAVDRGLNPDLPQDLETAEHDIELLGRRPLRVLRYPRVEGSHLATSVKQLIAMVEAVVVLHDRETVHGDLRLANVLFREQAPYAVLIDFDFAGRPGQATYPLAWQKVGDGRRHPKVKGGRPLQFAHDAFSLYALVTFFRPCDGQRLLPKRFSSPPRSGNVRKWYDKLLSALRLHDPDLAVELVDKNIKPLH